MVVLEVTLLGCLQVCVFVVGCWLPWVVWIWIGYDCVFAGDGLTVAWCALCSVFLPVVDFACGGCLFGVGLQVCWFLGSGFGL